jgi:TolB-like protein/Tfp pilus assembly protein PilF
MARPPSSARTIAFGAYEADFYARELRKSGTRRKLQEKPFAVLELLLKNAGELVTREDIRRALWPSDTHLDFEHSLSIAVHKLRLALGDTAENPRFVETLSRRGYRFIAPVRSPTEATMPGGKTMLAVLPFSSLSAAHEQDYFIDGLTEEMITQLGRLNPESLGVIARTSAMRYKQSEKAIDEIGRELGVDHILEGSVRRQGSRVRISAQLNRVIDQVQRWSGSFDRSTKDVLSLQREVAEEIARALAIELVPFKEPAPTVTHGRTRALELYRRGRHLWSKRTEEAGRKAIELFNLAICADPGFALAYVGLADCYGLFGYYGTLPSREAFAKSKENACKALAIDDRLAEAHGSLAFAYLQDEWDWPASQKEHLTAIQLNANYAAGHHWYGLDLTQMGRFQQALAALECARKLDPYAVAVHAHVGRCHYFSRDNDEAILQMNAAIAMDSDYAPVRYFLGLAYVEAGKLEKGVAELKLAVQMSNDHPACIAGLAYAYGVQEKQKEAAKTVERLESVARKRFVSAYFKAFALASQGEPDRVLENLQQAYSERFGWMFYLKMEPAFDPLRTDARFAELLERVNPLQKAKGADAG